MQIVKIPGPQMLGMVLGPDTWQLQINQREIATLKRAVEIQEEARDRLREAMGWESFEDSDLYTLRVDELAETPIINFDYDFSRVDSQ